MPNIKWHEFLTTLIEPIASADSPLKKKTAKIQEFSSYLSEIGLKKRYTFHQAGVIKILTN